MSMVLPRLVKVSSSSTAECSSCRVWLALAATLTLTCTCSFLKPSRSKTSPRSSLMTVPSLMAVMAVELLRITGRVSAKLSGLVRRHR